MEGWSFGGTCADAACSRCIPGPDTSDVAGWGTHGAGTIAGQSLRVAGASPGVAPGVSIMPLQVSDHRRDMGA